MTILIFNVPDPRINMSKNSTRGGAALVPQVHNWWMIFSPHRDFYLPTLSPHRDFYLPTLSRPPLPHPIDCVFMLKS